MAKGFKQIKYSKADEQFLIDNYATLGNKKCAELLNRSITALNHKVKKMNLTIDWSYTYTSVQGYLVDCTDRNNKQAKHRQIMEQKIGRPLTAQDIVHHIDENKLNNNPENLELLTRASHINLHRPKLMAAKLMI